MSSFGTLLKAEREKTGLTQAELSSRTGIPQKTLSNYEIDKSEPSWSAVRRISAALGVSCELFIGSDEQAEESAKPKSASTTRPKAKTKRKGG